MLFGVNDSPLAGRDGKQLTSTVISDRLAKEAETNVAINIQNAPAVPGMSDALEVRRCRLLAAALHSLTCITGPGRLCRVNRYKGVARCRCVGAEGSIVWMSRGEQREQRADTPDVVDGVAFTHMAAGGVDRDHASRGFRAIRVAPARAVP